MPLVEIIKEKCDLSYSCVRVCPVNAIEVKVNKDYARIIPERCIGCGSCTSVCPQDAIRFLDSKEQTKILLKEKGKKVAVVAPSISGEFHDITDYRKFVQMFKQLGFDHVNEVSFGADIISLKYAELFNNFKGKYYISTACPVIVSYVQKFQPELIDNLVPLVSPMIATAKIVRKLYGNDTKVIYIGPCIENKNEATDYSGEGRIDAVLTFIELRELFNEFNIHESTLEFSEFDAPIGYKGSLFPISNGIIQASNISEDLLTGTVITAEGKSNMINATRQFYEEIKTIKKHFNLYYCEGCLMGPGTSRGGQKFIRRTRVTNYANKRLKNFDLKTWEKEIEKYWDLDYSRTFKSDDQRIETPSEEKIQEVLKAIGKENGNPDLGCNACGYNSCRDFAIAVSKGLAKTEMCLTFTLRNRHEYIKSLRSTNEKLAQTQKALQDSEQVARKEKEAAQEASDIINNMLHKLNAGIVIIDKNLKIIQSNTSFIDILGEEAKAINEVIPQLVGADLKTLVPFNIYNLFNNVFSTNENILNRDIYIDERFLNLSIFVIRKDKIVGAVIRDMYSPEVRKEEVIKRVNDVIDKNLEMVQKIGFLLGEGASETEQMLNSIVELYKTFKKEE
ncbi:MAG: histidine kinase [Bacteroidetes bacterium GWC2_33_15]|nr:MAG: histidine kinase [Bacteroidetes bacterium GWA2_33_15]OFX50300.1 MAG: histidine kinase [Bacteroidetes bacterium GWC2_33_15]OFX66783.1 MAG: histidine kinase [Bacteroidetes bacterium GWB2_32_14]OFX69401.1 MAG: histidine kinase [Bacteroidetes bacterium GWD2_33_33]HAN18724.1 histidine kinase [Bacteroidales bacterium]